MGAELIDDSLLAGARAEDADVDSAAAINPLKVATRPFYIPLIFRSFTSTGSPSSVQAGVFGGIRLRDAAADTITIAAKTPRGEIVSGRAAKLHVFWLSTATSGVLRLVADIKPIIDGFDSLDSALQRTILSDAPSVAGNLQQATFEFPAAIFSKSQIVSVKISRDPDNSLDTLGANADIYSAYLEMTGRC